MSTLESLKARYVKNGQDHLFSFFDGCNAEEKEEFLSCLKEVDVDDFFSNTWPSVMKTKQEAALLNSAAVEEKGEGTAVAPFTEIVDSSEAKEDEKKQWWDHGLDLIAGNKVACVLMAGGQGTRLGFDQPKGCFDLLLPSRKTLFQLQAERLKRAKTLAAAKQQKNESSLSVPFYIMTSTATHDATIRFFREHDFFGLPPQDVLFFQQGQLPAVTPDGKIILETRSKISLAPNGNGGIYLALKKAGILDDMKRRGVEGVHVFGVDNALVRVADPSFIGFSHLHQADCVNKVVLKEDPSERVGVMVRRGGRCQVMEYSEMSPETSRLRGENGRLLYSAANIAQHFFSRTFLETCASAQLPFHWAEKKIASIDAKGHASSVNGIKMEMFIFDVFPLADKIFAFAVRRDEEFAPIKNACAPGAVDTPDTARCLISKYHARLLLAAGGKLQVGTTGADIAKSSELGPLDLFEVSPLTSYQGEGLEDLVSSRTLIAPCQL